MSTPPGTKPRPAAKRALDLLGAAAGLLLTAPLMGLIALAIRLTSRGPVMFAQERVGLGGRPFRVLKFRTMAGPPRFEVGRETRADDPRITPIGRVLRLTGLDELPQLVNVLRGEMSLVGPRPLLAWEIALCDDRQAGRLDVPPGLTGLAQVKGRNAIPWSERIEWDLAYVERAGILADLAILAATPGVILRGGDAYASTGVTLRVDEPCPAPAGGRCDSRPDDDHPASFTSPTLPSLAIGTMS